MKPKLGTEKRVDELLSYDAASVEAFATPTIGVKVISFVRYMPSPAGFIDIDAMSPPSEVSAPPMAIERAVPKLCDVCE